LGKKKEGGGKETVKGKNWNTAGAHLGLHCGTVAWVESGGQRGGGRVKKPRENGIIRKVIHVSETRGGKFRTRAKQGRGTNNDWDRADEG